jgi:HSP20 family molecular chaperone IbpA
MNDFDFEEILKRLQEETREFSRSWKEIEEAIESGKIKGEWQVETLNEPNIKGYVIQGRFSSNEPFEPIWPFQPINPSPIPGRPSPQRRFTIPSRLLNEVREPLADVFNESNFVKIYVHLPGEKKDDIQLNITDTKAEVKTKRSFTSVDLPKAELDLENVQANFRKGVLEVVIPKKMQLPEETRRKIKVE